MTTINEFLDRIAAAQGDIHTQSALTAEFVVYNQPEERREALRAVLDAAAVLRWFDAHLLAQVMPLDNTEARRRVDWLKALPFVEPYRGGEREVYNVHEATRLGWRKRLYEQRLAEFRQLSLNAAQCFVEDLSTVGRIEWIYHLLSGDPETGATELENLDRQWTSQARPEDYFALASTLKELEDSQLVSGRARCWTLLVMAWARDMRGETAQLHAPALAILTLAKEFGDDRACAHTNCLLGDVYYSQGQLDKALAAYDEYLAISRRLAELDPGNAGWQRELAVALFNFAVVLVDLNRIQKARPCFAESLAIVERLARLNPMNEIWQSELAFIREYIHSLG